jgi:hypothetical protein
MKLVRLKTLELAAGNPITPEQQVQAAAIVASGLVSAPAAFLRPNWRRGLSKS